MVIIGHMDRVAILEFVFVNGASLRVAFFDESDPGTIVLQVIEVHTLILLTFAHIYFLSYYYLRYFQIYVSK